MAVKFRVGRASNGGRPRAAVSILTAGAAVSTPPSDSARMAIRLTHFSDVHLTAAPLGWRVRDVMGKRATGWVNVRLLGRGHRFRHADAVAAALVADLRTRRPDHLVFTGDATTLAFESEMAAAARRLEVGDPSLPPGVAVPGNHDRYTYGAARRETFEARFRPWLQGERVDGNTYPFARKVGHVWLIAVNSSRATPMPWDASGRVGPAQLDRLRALVGRLDAGPRVVVTHYPILTKALAPEPYWRRLRDWKRVRAAAAECGVGLWLHGHRHGWYVLPKSEAMPFPSICAGSATQTRRWGYHEYAIDGWKLSAQRRVYDPAAGAFADAETFEVNLAHPGNAF